MSMTDPISDMLTRIRNAQMVAKKSVMMPASSMKKSLCSVLQKEGYIRSFELVEASNSDTGHPQIKVNLKYFQGKPVIEYINRSSKPGLRLYKGKHDLPKVDAGFGTAIISTSKGLLTDFEAREAGVGGEVICVVK
jgi:small subunit ribosomal protein S8